jgi:hypothetical protein
MPVIRERVAKGIALLDSRIPEWRENVDVDRLEIYSTFDCVLAQVFGGYGEGLALLGIRTDMLAASFGFEAYEHEEFPEITMEWKRALAE